MSPDLTVNSQRTAVTLPGAESSVVFNKVYETGEITLRRVQSTANTFPRELIIGQLERKLGTRAGTRRTQVIVKERDLSTIVPLESGNGGRADGEATVVVTLVRPTAPGFQTTFSNNKMKTLFCQAFDCIMQNIDALIAGEK